MPVALAQLTLSVVEAVTAVLATVQNPKTIPLMVDCEPPSPTFRAVVLAVPVT